MYYLIGFIVFPLFLLVVFVSCDQELSVSKPEKEPENCRLILSSNPPGYQIYLDDKIMGKKTPDSLIYLESAEYEVTLKHPYFLDTTVVIPLYNNESGSFSYDFSGREEFYSKISCFTNPDGAEIFLDGNTTGKYTPSLLEHIYPGEHKISFSKIGYWAKEFEIILLSNKTTEVYTGLVDTTIWIVFDTVNSQLPSNYITKIGYDLDFGEQFWLGTSDAGVVDVSSSQWQHYTPENSVLPAKDITGIQLGPQNKVMIGTNYGVVLIENGNWELFTAENSILPSSIVSCLEFENNYWSDRRKFYIGLKGGGGVAIYTEDGMSIDEELNNVLPSRNISCIKEFDGRVAIGTDDAGVLVYSPNYNTSRTKYYNMENAGFITNKIMALGVYDDMDRMFVAAQKSDPHGHHIGKLYLKDEFDVWKELPLHDHTIYSISIDFGTVWVGTANGLYHLDPSGNIIEHFTAENSYLVSNHIYDVKVDRAGNLWIATGGGLVRYKQEN